MSESLTVKFLLPLFIPYITQALQSSSWADQHAGLQAIAMLSEGCQEYFKNDLSNIMK